MQINEMILSIVHKAAHESLILMGLVCALMIVVFLAQHISKY